MTKLYDASFSKKKLEALFQDLSRSFAVPSPRRSGRYSFYKTIRAQINSHAFNIAMSAEEKYYYLLLEMKQLYDKGASYVNYPKALTVLEKYLLNKEAIQEALSQVDPSLTATQARESLYAQAFTGAFKDLSELIKNPLLRARL